VLSSFKSKAYIFHYTNSQKMIFKGNIKVFIIIMIIFSGCKSMLAPKLEYSQTQSGLKYSVIKKGNGISPVNGDLVIIHYTGTLEDGSIFERSRDRNAPVSFRIGSNQLIDGLLEGLKLMRVGDHFSLIIPPNLAYGQNQVGIIPPNSTLNYVVELIDVKKGIEISKPAKEKYEKKVTSSGLVYAVVEKGKGAKAFEGLVVKIQYTGFFGDDIIFDSSQERGKPLEAKLGDGTLIMGLEEGLTYLHQGDKARLWIPSDLAYGSEGRGLIPPDTDLVFDVEILEVKEAPVVFPFVVSGKDTIETLSGLKYIVVSPGRGEHPKPGQIVKLHYSAYLTNGFMFDSSLERSEPFSVVAGKGLMIKGWEEGVMLMKRNAKFRFIIPHHLAFGKKSMGNVPAFSTVIFDIELIEIIDSE
jgi:FKBP-type peptidyl-prolyl cis-trans isomerase